MNIRKLAAPGFALLLIMGPATTAVAKVGDVEVAGTRSAPPPERSPGSSPVAP